MLEVKNLSKVYEGKVPHRALTDINLSIEKGEFVGIMGPSGSGKTTLLNMIATIDEPTTGEILINGKNPHTLGKNDLAKFRRREMGFVFQDFNLLNTLTLEENIVLPLTLDNTKVKEMEEKAYAIAQKLGIAEILNKRTFEISGGQAQRVAIARAMIHEPSLVLADEPTGALDSKASQNLLDIFADINETGQTILMVTHSARAASYSKRVLFIRDGRVYHELYRGDQTTEQFMEKITQSILVSSKRGDLDE